jgi:hypothetical protein
LLSTQVSAVGLLAPMLTCVAACLK